jgi:hypothetical protein
MVPTTMFDGVEINNLLLDDECHIIVKRIMVWSFARTTCFLVGAPLIEGLPSHGQVTAGARIRQFNASLGF